MSPRPPAGLHHGRRLTQAGGGGGGDNGGDGGDGSAGDAADVGFVTSNGATVDGANITDTNTTTAVNDGASDSLETGGDDAGSKGGAVCTLGGPRTCIGAVTRPTVLPGLLHPPTDIQGCRTTHTPREGSSPGAVQLPAGRGTGG